MPYTRTQSQHLFERAQHSLAGGVGSSVRLAEQPGPLYFERGEGARLYDADGNTYIDYVLGQGPLILGHSPRVVREAVHRQVDQLIMSGGEHTLEIELSERLTRIVPCCEQVRYNNSGSEAVQMALRIARAHTSRTKYIKFEGHFHGWLDSVSISTAPSAAQLGPRHAPTPVLGSEGIPASVLDQVVLLPWNDLSAVADALAQHGHEIAALLTEPIMFNAGGCQPKPGYLAGLRELCSQYGVVLIFDEVISGFRVALGGAQELYGVTPDLAVFAKGIAGGLPLSALAGRRALMELVASGRVLYAGTYNTHPIVMAAANATTAQLESERGTLYAHLHEMGKRLSGGLQQICAAQGVRAVVNAVGPVVQLTFTQRASVDDYRDYLERDIELSRRFTSALAQHGVRATLRGTWYLSTAHCEADIEETLDRANAALEDTQRA